MDFFVNKKPHRFIQARRFKTIWNFSVFQDINCSS